MQIPVETPEKEVIQIDGYIIDPETGEVTGEVNPDDSPITAERVGKSRAGRLLDGLEWNEFPEENK